MIRKGRTLADKMQAAGDATFRVQVNDGSDRPPGLLTGFSNWGLIGLMDDALLKAKLKRVAEAGYDFFEGHWADADAAGEAGELADSLGLKLVYQGHVSDAGQLHDVLESAARARAIAVNCHVFDEYVDELGAARLADEFTRTADRAGIPLFIETHRGCITQDLLRTIRWADRCTCRFNLDVSHWALCGQMGVGIPDDVISRLEAILDRVGMIHGRITNGQQVQVSLADVNEQVVISYQRLWATAMGRWKRSARAGDVFLFEPELGPPAYAMLDRSGHELCDRWEESKQMTELARSAWAAVK